MLTSRSKPLVLSGFGYAIVPEWHYQDLVSENEIKRDRIAELTGHRNSALGGNTHLENVIGSLKEDIKYLERQSEAEKNALSEQLRIIDANGDRQKATIQHLREQVRLLELADRTAGEVIDHLNAEIFGFRTKLLDTQKELDAIKETYRKTLATNAELNLKLIDAIAPSLSPRQT